jgi:hypothetical protein
MPLLRAFVTYYVRSALPFLTGLAFGLMLFRFDIPLFWQIAGGAVLVVAGPLAIQVILVLLVEALRGSPGDERSTRDVRGAPPTFESLRPPRRLP